MRRTQIYLEEHQARELAKLARDRETTSSHVIREAVEQYLARPEEERGRRLARFRAALETTFASMPRLPDGRTYVDEVRRGEQDRSRELDERRHR